MPTLKTVMDALDPWAAWGRGIKGMLLIKCGERLKGLRCLQMEIDEMRDTGYMLPYTTSLGGVAECMPELGRIDEGLATAPGEYGGWGKRNPRRAFKRADREVGATMVRITLLMLAPHR